MATLVPHGKRIKIRFHINGIQRFTTVPVNPTKTNIEAVRRQAREAEQRLRLGDPWDAVRAWLRGEQIATVEKTLGYYAQHLFDHAEVKDSTLKQYLTNYNNYWLDWDKRPISGITRIEVKERLAKFNVTNKTKRNALSTLSQIFEVAVDNGDIEASPVSSWKFRMQQKPEIDPYNEQERDALLANMPAVEAHQFFYMAFHSGMRTGELLALDWNHVDRPEVIVELNRTRSRLTTIKTDQIRRVRLHPGVWDSLEQNQSRWKKGFVFLRPNGIEHLDGKWLMQQWHDAHDNSGVRRRSNARHPWRHTYISLALASGAAPIWVAKQAGHDLKTMVEKYARWIKGRDEAEEAEMLKVYPNMYPIKA